MFRELLSRDKQKDGLALTLECAFMAEEGTVQLVLRNEDQLPAMRGYMVSQGAQVKPGTMDGDRIYTCTVVLGQVKDAEEANRRLPYVRKYLEGQEEGRCFSTTVLTVMEYWDFGLEACNELKTMALA